jgi:ketosteroid isomerase-like protein
MRIHRSLVLVLLISLSVRAASAQAPASIPLQHAERAFADSLVNHDRAAFVAMLAPDAESTLPTLKRGPEAIADSWLPFFIDRGTTMILTSTEVVTAAAGDSGSSSGTFAIRGRTASGIQTVPGGTYALTWRLVDGRWKITGISGGGPANSGSSTPNGGSGNVTRRVADTGGVGKFRFGMTRDEVTRVGDCSPYAAVAVTGGLECPRFTFDDREMNISFIFGGDRLRPIQLWFYEGNSSAEAGEAVGRVIAFLQRTTGGATITARPGLPVTAAAVIDALNAAPPPRGRQMVQIEICGPAGERSEVWVARVGRHEYGYGVILLADSAAGR